MNEEVVQHEILEKVLDFLGSNNNRIVKEAFYTATNILICAKSEIAMKVLYDNTEMMPAICEAGLKLKEQRDICKVMFETIESFEKADQLLNMPHEKSFKK